MKFLKSILITSLSATLLLGASEAKPTKQDKALQESVELGNKISKTLLLTLNENIKKRMEEGGVMKTFEFCSDEAFNLTKKINKKASKGVKIRRISSKYRSPANAPKSEDAAVLESFQNVLKTDEALPPYLTRKVDSNTYKYYKPLVIKDKACLECHGKVSKNIDLRRKVAQAYPLDRSVGYKMGDLIGAIVVTVKR